MQSKSLQDKGRQACNEMQLSCSSLCTLSRFVHMTPQGGLAKTIQHEVSLASPSRT